MASTSAPLVFFLPVLWSLALTRESPVWVNTSSGSLSVLPCPCPPSPLLLLLQWLRVDLKHDGYVYDKRTVYMHPRYRGRVHLRGPQPHACDLELVNVSSSDSGQYICMALSRGPAGGSAGGRTELKSRYVVELRVKDLSGGNNRDQRVEDNPPRRPLYGLISATLLLTILLFLLFIRLRRNCTRNSGDLQPPDPHPCPGPPALNCPC